MLRTFDDLVSNAVTEELEEMGINVMKNSNVSTQ